ncbi:DEAD/DEAH box helicase [Fodinibius sediminis]|uniref:Superfamily II DNA and RNA helicase n=1 Tax=Fodinibius sediminis TaxID=1214077 RepID=A0A521B0H7_9BACT|nr:DEAD/DEAH box helicase [Fodinibius sediminis]SMO40270.1 Superfamily II DNA and RNA helicase [Fodinibius sediminis]
MSFKKFTLSDQLHLGLRDLRYEEPTPIQKECIPLILEGRDVIGAAQTGTGKTGAFVIPLLQRIIDEPSDDTQALILSPTRELAQQIEEQIFALGYHTGISSATVTGGSDYGTQVKAIRAGVDIIVATPGRLIDQMKVLNIDFSHLKYLVLDEADRMLDMGFLPDVMKIVDQLPKERQTMLFSATMVEEVQKVVDKVMKDPVEVEFEVSKPADSVDQQIYFVHPKQKLNLFEQLFDADKYETAIVFCATKRGTDEVERMLKKRGVNAVSMHGDRDQEERNEALRLFKNKTHPVMVATDVLSRGIDIDDVSLIVNFDVPNNPEDYIHRIGRTGRYDKSGTAITFVSNKDKKYYYSIKKVVGDQLSVRDLPGKNEESKPSTSKSKRKERPSRDSKAGKPQKESKSTDSRSNGKRPKKEKKKPEKDSPSQQETRKKQPQKNGSRNKKRSNRENGGQKNKGSGKKKTSGRSGRSDKKEYSEPVYQEEDIFQPEVIEQAVVRNRRSLKPAKGFVGVIKSFIPKLF